MAESEALKAAPPPPVYSSVSPPQQQQPPPAAIGSYPPQDQPSQDQPYQHHHPGLPPPGHPPSSGYGPGPGHPYSGYGPMPGYPPSGYGPVPGYQPPVSTYYPVPPTFQHQNANSNAVIGQQPQGTQGNAESPPNTYVTLTLILLLISILHCNMVAFLCLLPALFCACIASDKIVSGELSTAKDCGAFALVCNIFAIMYYVLAIIAGIAVLIVIVSTR